MAKQRRDFRSGRKFYSTANNADRYDLYQRSVQASADADARFLEHRYRLLRGRPLRALREDFCGTALLCCEFVKMHPENRAVGVDLDPEPLEWCRQNNFPRLTQAQRLQITLLRANVLAVKTQKVELIAAMNYSYCIFKRRQEMLTYLRNAKRALVQGGILMVDAHGGSEVQSHYQEVRDLGDFTYIAEENHFDPITHNMLLGLHYRFKDGSQIRNAFTYNFRLWTLPELQDLFWESGFRDVHVLWNRTNPQVHSSWVYQRVTHVKSDSVWIACVVGQA